MNRTVVITGGGSGVGRAVALKFAAGGWRAAILGRRREALEETFRMAGENAPQLIPHACDIGDPAAVERTARDILAELQTVEVLVNAAGTNAPRRALEVLSLDDYHAMMAANLHGAFYCARAFLPGMRARGRGTIVNIVSDAGKQASAKAGSGYVMSKFGLVGLTQSINAEERARGIRACAILPGDIDTPLLDQRPEPPSAEARARMMRAEDIAECVWFCVNLPARAVVEELLIRPR